jgi:DNA-binding transcriptional ArsR family regulator
MLPRRQATDAPSIEQWPNSRQWKHARGAQMRCYTWPMAKQSPPELHQVLAALGDPVRLDIVRQLADRGEVPCGGFGQNLAKSTLSHHFRVLREAGLVGARSEGTSLLNYLERDAIERKFPGLLTGVLGVPEKSSQGRN